MKYYFLIVLLIFYTNYSFSQEQKIDFSTKEFQEVEALLTQAEEYRKAKNNEKAIVTYKKLIEVFKSYYGDTHSYYGVFLNNLAYIYTYHLKEYEKALPLNIESLLNAEKSLGKESKEYKTRLKNLLELNEKIGEGDNSLFLRREALKLSKKTFNKEHPFYATCLFNLAIEYYKNKKYKKALPLFKQSLEINKKNKLTHNYLVNLNWLATLHSQLHNYQESINLCLEAVKKSESVFGIENNLYKKSVENTYSLYISFLKKDNYSVLMNRALDKTKIILGDKHKIYIVSLIFLLKQYYKEKEYQNAIPQYEKFINNFKDNPFLKSNHQYWELKNNLSEMYINTGQNEKGLYSVIQILKNAEVNRLDKESKDYKTSIHHLVVLLENLKEEQSTTALNQEKILFIEKILNKNSPKYKKVRKKIAKLYLDIGKYNKSLILYTEERKKIEKAFGQEHLNYGLILGNLAHVYFKMENNEKAISLYSKALTILSKNSETKHPSYNAFSDNLNHLYEISGNSINSKSEQFSYNDWKPYIKKGDSLFIIKEYSLAIKKYERAKIIGSQLDKTPAYIISLDRLNDAYRANYSSAPKKIFKGFSKHIDETYNNEHELRNQLKDTIVHAIKNKKPLLETYIQSLFKVNKKRVVLPAIKEIAIIEELSGNYENAAYFFEQWEKIDTIGIKDFYTQYINSAINYGHIFYKRKKYKKAIYGYEKAGFLMGDSPNLNEKFYESIYQSLFRTYAVIAELEVAKTFSEELIKYYKQKYGDTSDKLGAHYNELGTYYMLNNDSEIAKLCFGIAVDTYIVSKKIDDPNYEIARFNYFQFLKKENNTQEKLRILNLELALYQLLSLKNENYIKTLQQYISLVKNDTSKTKEIKDKLLELITLYKDQKDFNKNYVEVFEALSSIYINNSENDKSFQLLKENKVILDNIAPKYQHVYTTCAYIALKGDKDNDALMYINKALQYYKNINAPYIYRAETLKIKTLIVAKIQGIDQGKKVFYTHKARMEKENLTNTVEYADLLIIEQTLKDNFSIYPEEETLEKALRKYKTSGDTNSPNYFTIISDYAQALALEKNYTLASQYYLKAYKYYSNELENEIKYKAASAKDFKINKKALRVFSQIQYLNYTLQKSDATLHKTAIDIALLSKNLKLNVTSYIFNKIKTLQNEKLNKNIEAMNRRSLKLSSSIDYRKKLNSKKIDKLLKEYQDLNKIFYEIIIEQYFNNFSKKLLTAPNFKDIKLNPKSIFIDYVKTENFQYEDVYLAYIYKPNTPSPEIIYLGLESDLKKLTTTNSLQNLSYTSRGAVAENKAINGKQLFKFVWKPIKSIVENYQTIYFSFDGLLHKIPMAAIQDTDGKILANKYDLHQLSNVSSLLKKNKTKPDYNDILCYGGINYNTSLKENTINGFDYLPGTLEEVKAIKEIIPTSKILNDSIATEDQFWRLSGKSPSVLHIATHGFYHEYEKEPKGFGKQFKISKNPLKRSGLLLSDGNTGMSIVSDKADGVLTSAEISYLDLSNTQLVVLSACETALGDIDGSEGVYGLQRAFKIAGVDKIIMSLWEVPDAETAEFMQLFYAKWNELNNIDKAFRSAQGYMAKKYKYEPEKWSAFILVN